MGKLLTDENIDTAAWVLRGRLDDPIAVIRTPWEKLSPEGRREWVAHAWAVLATIEWNAEDEPTAP